MCSKIESSVGCKRLALPRATYFVVVSLLELISWSSVYITKITLFPVMDDEVFGL